MGEQLIPNLEVAGSNPVAVILIQINNFRLYSVMVIMFGFDPSDPGSIPGGVIKHAWSYIVMERSLICVPLIV